MRRSSLVAVIVVGSLLVPLGVFAAHQFNDVPSSNTFHNAIGWMKDNNITVGCNPPANTNYCPNDNVTRGQMAAFMRRLAENKVVDAATAVEADQVGGFSAAELAPRAAFTSNGNLPDASNDMVVEIVAPAPGVLVMNGTVDVTSSGAAATVACRLLVDGVQLSGTFMYDTVGPAEESICATTGALAVDEGSHSVTFRVSVADPVSLYDASVNVIWLPFDGTGSTPQTVTPSSRTESEEKPVG